MIRAAKCGTAVVCIDHKNAMMITAELDRRLQSGNAAPDNDAFVHRMSHPIIAFIFYCSLLIRIHALYKKKLSP